MRTKFLGAAAVVAIGSLWLTPALANPVTTSGEIDGGYSYVTANHGGSANDWNINGAAITPIANNWAVQGNGGYNNLSATGLNESTGYGAISGAYVDKWGRLGVAGSYSQLSVAHDTLDAYSYGAFGDWYLAPDVTLSARGGGISGSAHAMGHSANFSGAYYVGGQGVVYPLPDMAVRGTIEYVAVPVGGTNINSTDYAIGGEYLVSRQFPVSVSASYTYTNLSFLGLTTGNGSTVSVGLKYYFGGNGSLIDHQRSETDGWAASSPIETLTF
jgi:hypothetical protein